MDLSGASDLKTRAFIMDLGANGLRFKREDNQPFDTADLGGKSYQFDGEWGRAKMSEDEYEDLRGDRRGLCTDAAGPHRHAEALVAGASRHHAGTRGGLWGLPSLCVHGVRLQPDCVTEGGLSMRRSLIFTLVVVFVACSSVAQDNWYPSQWGAGDQRGAANRITPRCSKQRT